MEAIILIILLVVAGLIIKYKFNSWMAQGNAQNQAIISQVNAAKNGDVEAMVTNEKIIFTHISSFLTNEMANIKPNNIAVNIHIQQVKNNSIGTSVKAISSIIHFIL